MNLLDKILSMKSVVKNSLENKLDSLYLKWRKIVGIKTVDGKIMASNGQIRKWAKIAEETNAQYLILMTDNSSDFEQPLFFRTEEEILECMKSGTRVMRMIFIGKDVEEQIEKGCIKLK